MDGKGELYPAIDNLIHKYALLEEWGDTTVYKNRDGEIIPETRDLMWAIKVYYLEKAKRKSNSTKSNSPYDIG